MSRYPIPADATYRAVVGWDPPLRTFFGQVDDLTILAAVRRDKDDHRDPRILWVGAEADAIQDVEDLRRLLARYASIPAEIEARLRQDQATSPPRTPLQEHMLKILAHVRKMP